MANNFQLYAKDGDLEIHVIDIAALIESDRLPPIESGDDGKIIVADENLGYKLDTLSAGGYTSADFDTDFASKSTTDLSEGTNLYYTDARVGSYLTANNFLQSGDNVSTLTNDAGYITGYTVTEGDVTAHEAALAITESQITDLGSYLTDLSGLTTDDLSEGVSNLYYTDERVDDRVSALLIGGTNVTLTYDDGANTLTIDATAGAGLTEEQVQDFAWNVLTGTQTLISVTYDDANDNVDFVVDNNLANYDNSTSAFLTSVDIADINATGTADNTTYLRGDGTWDTVSGGGGTPAGSDGEVQFNNSGSFGASADVTIDSANGYLRVHRSATEYLHSGHDGGAYFIKAEDNGSNNRDDLRIGTDYNQGFTGFFISDSNLMGIYKRGALRWRIIDTNISPQNDTAGELGQIDKRYETVYSTKYIAKADTGQTDPLLSLRNDVGTQLTWVDVSGNLRVGDDFSLTDASGDGALKGVAILPNGEIRARAGNAVDPQSDGHTFVHKANVTEFWGANTSTAGSVFRINNMSSGNVFIDGPDVLTIDCPLVIDSLNSVDGSPGKGHGSLKVEMNGGTSMFLDSSNKNRSIHLGDDVGSQTDAQVKITNAVTGRPALILQGVASQTAPLLSLWDDVGTEVSHVDLNGNYENTQPGEGVILASPDGTRYKVTVDNAGNLTTTAI